MTPYHRVIFPAREELHPMLTYLPRILKALAAAASAGVAAYGTAVSDGAVTAEDWIKLTLAAIGAGLLVWAVPNKPQDIPGMVPNEPQDAPST